MNTVNQHMRLILGVLLLNSGTVCSQSFNEDLKFNTEYYDAVDEWVAFPKKEVDTSYAFGFIYIDEQAGFTFDYNSDFIVTKEGLKKLPRPFESSLKSRLSRNTIDVAILSDEQRAELKLPETPKWLAIYKDNSDEPDYLKNIGLHYNAAGASNLALKPLLKAYEMQPHLDGLEFELAFAYNALKQFKQAVEILESAIENDPNNFLFYRELGFSFLSLGQIEKAEMNYQKGIKLTDNKSQIAEMAVNMALIYFRQKNVEKFNEWAKLTRENSERGSRFTQLIDAWEENLNK